MADAIAKPVNAEYLRYVERTGALIRHAGRKCSASQSFS
jgi:hypothetical protein